MYETSSNKPICSTLASFLLWGGALVLPILLLALNSWFGNLNQDEGWYLYAAQQVAHGATPYKDFMFTQGPVFPYVMSLFTPIIDLLGVWGGRLVNAGLGWCSIVMAGLLAASLAPKSWKKYALVITVILAGVNVYQTYFFTVVKTYSMAAFFFNAGLLCFVKASRKASFGASCVCAVFLVLATGCRLSAGLALPIVGLYLLINRKRLGNENWVTFGITGLFALMLLWVPFLTMAHDVFVFGVFKYHTLRESGGANPWVMKAGFISRVVQAYFVAFLLSPLLFTCRCNKSDAEEAYPEVNPKGIVLLILLAVTLLHLSAGFPYDDYQVFLYPALCALLAVALCGALKNIPQYRGRVGLFLLVASAAASFSSPINQDWFVYGRDRIWWLNKEASDIAILRDAGAHVRSIASSEKLLITQDTYLAVEAGMQVPSGMEMGVFSFYPELSDVEAKALKVMNESILSQTIAQSTNAVCALSDYSFALSAPGIVPVEEGITEKLRAQVEGQFTETKRYSHFGQGHTELIIYTQKK